jgi:hypothetical protein
VKAATIGIRTHADYSVGLKDHQQSFIVLHLYKLEHLVSNDHIPVVLEYNLVLSA